MNAKKEYKLYKDFSPTAFDSKGAFLPDRQDWIVLPVAQNRDSGPFDRSNFESALKMLYGESDSVEVHRFGHWGPGWYEIILVDPNSDKIQIVDDIIGSLENYPVLDEEDYSEKQFSDYEEGWKNWACSDFTKIVTRELISEKAINLVESADSFDLMSLYESGIRSGEYYFEESGGLHIPVENSEVTRKMIADFIRGLRAGL